MPDENTRTILVILGMHRSGTSATAGVFARMGLTPPKHLMAAAPMNAAGFYESEEITSFNERLMARLGLTWFDLNEMPRDWIDLLDTSWLEEGAALLQSEFEDATVAILKDPRICRLLPFWMKVFERAQRKPVFACIFRPPAEVAGSMNVWANYATEYGELLWVRYVLEAEANSRGTQRTFLSFAELLSDWPGTIARVARELGLTLEWTEDAHAEVDDFLSESLKHVKIAHGAPAATMKTAAEVFELMEAWRMHGEEANDFAELDAKLQILEAANGTLAPMANCALERYRHSTHAQTVLERVEKEVERLSEALNTSRKEYQAQTLAYHQEVQKLVALQSEYTDLCHQLAHARRKPIKLLGQLWKYKVLKRLGGDVSPLPARMKARFMRSAMKRHPSRSVAEWRAQASAYGAAQLPEKQNGVGWRKSTSAPQNAVPVQPELPHVLIVSHDASWTGAPILAYNLGRAYKDRYNVSVLCLNGGALLSVFADVAVHVEMLPFAQMPRADFNAKLLEILKKEDFAFAVVNSIESRHVLGVMREINLPTVSLLHEFASYTLPRTAFPEAIDNADTVVFSTSVTLENAIDVTGVGYNPKVRILPQGKCEVPRKSGTDEIDQVERDRLKIILKPKGDRKETLVIGAGTVQMRKGTDLFIEVARKTLSLPGGDNFRFVWFGGGYDPEGDQGYSIYLQDQIKRAGLEDRVSLEPITPEIEYVYEMADAFLLTSRLDPLPNVAIDAMLVGLPMVCFDKASGIPEILSAANLDKDCVAQYLDTSEMADKLLSIAGPDNLRVSAQTQAHAKITFDFTSYAEQIETWAKDIKRQFDTRPEAKELIRNSKYFEPDFMRPISIQNGNRDQDAQYYLDVCALGIYPRRPEPGFNQSIYCTFHAASEMPLGDAYADYLQKGRPEGPWKTSILQGPVQIGDVPQVSRLRVALHIHAYYAEALDDLLSRLRENLTRPTLFISVKDEQDHKKVESLLQDYDGDSQVRVVPNLGRDIGPFLTEFGASLTREFDVIGHVHTKKSVSLQDEESVERWSRFLLDNVLGGPQAGAMMDLQLAEFQSVPSLGVTFPADPNVCSWNLNKNYATRLSQQMGISELPDAIDFPVGTMFWIRSNALLPFVELDLGWSEYPSEPAPYDGSILHALERLFGVLPRLQGFGVRMTNVQGVTR